MKLVFAVVHPDDASRCTEALSGAGFPSTRFASAGGFLDHDNVTIMVGIDDPLESRVLEVLRASCRPHQDRVEVLSGAPAGTGPRSTPALDVEISGATVFVVPVESYHRL